MGRAVGDEVGVTGPLSIEPCSPMETPWLFTLNKKGGHLWLSSRAVTRYGAGRGVNIPETPDPQMEIRGCWEEQSRADAGERANNVYCTLGFPTVSDRKKIKQSMLLKPGILTHV